MHINRQNQILKFINHVKEKFINHINKVFQKSIVKNDNKSIKLDSKKKNIDHLLIANLHSPLLKSKMMQFEQILINSDH